MKSARLRNESTVYMYNKIKTVAIHTKTHTFYSKGTGLFLIYYYS